jgi:hypothetical protein
MTPARLCGWDGRRVQMMKKGGRHRRKDERTKSAPWKKRILFQKLG